MPNPHDIRITAYEPKQKDALIELSLRAWRPVFERMSQEILPFVYSSFYPDGWEVRQTMDVAALLDAEAELVFVASKSDQICGYVGLRLHPEDRMGEIHILAVDPDYQRQGVADALIRFAENRMRQEGLKMVMVETSGDSGHLAARKTYETSGFRQVPVARYFKEL